MKRHLGIVFVVLCFLLNIGWSAGESALKKSVIPKNGCYTGVYIESQFIKDFEDMVGKKITIVMNYSHINTGTEDLPVSLMNALWKLGHYSMFTLQPETWTLQEIIDGKYNTFIKKVAKQSAEFGKPLFLRWMHEMNGNWYIWSGEKNGAGKLDGYGDPKKPDGPERYVDAWRHIYKIFEKEGAKNVIWVWCPNDETHLGEWNNFENYYPGDEYVDWLGIDSYNWGTTSVIPGSRWKSFSEMFSPLYSRMEAINKDKPFMIGEFATTETGGSKPDWIKDAFVQMKKKFPRFKAFIWFSIYKETDWNLDSSEESLDAFYDAMKNPYYLGHINGVK
jgi:hypothetical protein